MISRHLQSRLAQLQSEFRRYGMHVERQPSRITIEPTDVVIDELSSAARSIGVALAYVRTTDRRRAS